MCVCSCSVRSWVWHRKYVYKWTILCLDGGGGGRFIIDWPMPILFVVLHNSWVWTKNSLQILHVQDASGIKTGAKTHIYCPRTWEFFSIIFNFNIFIPFLETSSLWGFLGCQCVTFAPRNRSIPKNFRLAFAGTEGFLVTKVSGYYLCWPWIKSPANLWRAPRRGAPDNYNSVRRGVRRGIEP